MAEKSDFREAERAQHSLLTTLEKKSLRWLAERMPAWINSDHLTALGLVGMLGVGLSYWLARWNPLGLFLATFFLVVNWFGDSLDGTLARVRNRQRPKYGFYIDHVLDSFGAFFVLGGLLLSGMMRPAVAAGLLIAYFMLSIEIYLATYTVGTFHLSFWIFGPTELRLLLAAGNVALLNHPTVAFFGESYRLFDFCGSIAIACMAIVLLVSFVRHARKLYQAEPLR